MGLSGDSAGQVRRLLRAVVCLALVLSCAPAAATIPQCAGRAATIVGTSGPDRLAGTARDDVIWGGGGDDIIEAGPGDDVVCGGPGDDIVWGEGGRDTLLGGGGADVLDGGSGDDDVLGGPGDDVLRGGAGADTIVGGDGADSLEGGPGADRLEGGPGPDLLRGGDDADRLLGGGDDDDLGGGGGDDLLRGGRGADLLAGEEGDDSLAGGGGDDSLVGGAGDDYCDGGAGTDTAGECEQVADTEAGQVAWPLLQPGPHQVALTFDDGPLSPYTAQILDILARYEVPATFFVMGRRAAAHPELLQRMVQEGHSVQNHTYDHYQLIGLSDAVIRDQIDRTSAEIEAAVGVAPRCVRPPYGVVDDRVRSIAADLGLATVLWDVNPADQGDGSWILAHTGGGDILLLHDSGGWATVGALPAVIEGLLAQGLEFVPLCSVPGLVPRRQGRGHGR
jgi:peptidoglycan/xylan/chitin deacetylase (PgdA/CDA1 family)